MSVSLFSAMSDGTHSRAIISEGVWFITGVNCYKVCCDHSFKTLSSNPDFTFSKSVVSADF